VAGTVNPTYDCPALFAGNFVIFSLIIPEESFLTWLNKNLGFETLESDYEKLITLDDLVTYISQRFN
jgi:hypothetical protein